MPFDRVRFAKAVRERIDNKDTDTLFEGGCCFHFALRAFERGLGQLVCVPTPGDPSNIPHAFVLTVHNLGFDHKGFRSIEEIDEHFKGPRVISPISEAEVQRKIAEKGLSDELAEEVFELANQIIDGHLRG